MLKRVLLPLTFALLAGILPLVLDARPAAALPAGFDDKLVTSADSATALTFTPDERLLITDKTGVLRVYKDGALLQNPALDISGRVCSNSERGMLGVAVDPDFGTPNNNYVYLYYTAKVGTTCDGSRDDVNRVSRFTMSSDTLDPGSEQTLINNIPSTNGNHNAGDLKFGKDGFLYVSVGDGGCDYAAPTNCQYENDASRDPNILLGKVLRITRDGGIPAGNPFTGTGSARCNATGRTSAGLNCQETFAKGLRNPFRMAFDPDAAGTSFVINDVGGASWEEIDQGVAGADYGWNVCEGLHDNPLRAGSVNCSTAFTPPVYEYSHNSGCSSITGGTFVPDGVWPAAYDDVYLFGDYVCGKIFLLTPAGSSEFASGIPIGPISMTFGPYRGGQALYYTTYDGGGQVRRIAYAGDFPTASINPNQTFGPELTIDFDASASTNPQGGLLTYIWNFGDGNSQTTTDPTNSVSHTYAQTGKYTVKLTVRNEAGREDTASVTVYPGDTPPEPKIEAPSTSALFTVGQSINLRGSATDTEDTATPNLTWRVVRHHNGNHTHPYFSGTGSSQSFTGPAPEELSATNPVGNYLEIRLTATDSLGLSKTVTQRLNPKTVPVRFATRPTDFRLTVNGRTFAAPRAFLSWQGYKLNVYAPAQRKDGRSWVFRSWSDNRGARHTITTPASPTRYTATFRERR